MLRKHWISAVPTHQKLLKSVEKFRSCDTPKRTTEEFFQKWKSSKYRHFGPPKSIKNPKNPVFRIWSALGPPQTPTTLRSGPRVTPTCFSDISAPFRRPQTSVASEIYENLKELHGSASSALHALAKPKKGISLPDFWNFPGTTNFEIFDSPKMRNTHVLGVCMQSSAAEACFRAFSGW